MAISIVEWSMLTALEDLDHPLDTLIAPAVRALVAGGIETFESCEGGPGHAYPEPTVRFHGDQVEGLRALVVAMRAGLSVRELRRVWPIVEGETTGPWWELTFAPHHDPAAQLPFADQLRRAQ